MSKELTYKISFIIRGFSSESTSNFLTTLMEIQLLFIAITVQSSAGKESTCNAGDSGSIPRLGRSTEEGIGYPLQYSWASLVAQLVKNPHTMWETWV